MEEDRYLVETLYIQGPSGPEPMTVGGALLGVPMGRARSGVQRPPDELQRALEPVFADSVTEACEKLDTRIRGNWEDLDGEARALNLLVRDPRDFQVGSLTRRDAALRGRYLEAQICDGLATELERRDAGPFADEDLAALEALAQSLEQSLAPEEDER